jgi:hypothetical protein
MIRPYKATEFSGLSLVQSVPGSAITPSTTWTKLPGTTRINGPRGDEFTSAASWRITDVIGGWAFYRATLTIEVDEDEEADYGFGLSGSNPTGIFVSKTQPLVGAAAAPATVIIEAWLELTAGQYVEPFAKIDGSATAELLVRFGTMSASREQNEL